MLGILARLGSYVLARAQERSTVAGVVAVGMSILGVMLPADQTGLIVSGVVAVAGMLAAVIPGGK